MMRVTFILLWCAIFAALALTSCAIKEKYAYSSICSDGSPLDSKRSPLSSPTTSMSAIRLPEQESQSLTSLPGDVFVLAFWATWCKQCAIDIAYFEGIADRLSAHTIQVVAIAIDRDPSLVQNFLNSHPISLPTFVDHDGDLQQSFHIDEVPSVVAFARTGKRLPLCDPSTKTRSYAITGLHNWGSAAMQNELLSLVQ